MKLGDGNLQETFKNRFNPVLRRSLPATFAARHWEPLASW
jgi:hypothetical protein